MSPVVRIPDLKEIASVSVAIALCNHVDIPGIVWIEIKDEEDCTTLIDEALELIDALTVPSSLYDRIKTQVNKVWQELDCWISHLSSNVLYTEGKTNKLYYHINEVIWYADGTIDYKRTARNLLDSLRLSEVEKYYIICSYCLEDEIQRLSPLLFTKKVVDHVNFESDPLIYYWNCYFRNELHKVPVGEGLSLDSVMFRHDSVYNWPAKEYFFDRLNVEEQVRNAIWLIDNDDTMCDYLKRLLMKLNESQLLEVYVNRSFEVMEHYGFAENNFQDILPTWYDIRELITQDKFVKIFAYLLSTEISGDILTEVWISAGDDFRNHILNHQNRLIFTQTFNWFYKNKDDSFLRTLLQDVSADVKLEITARPFFHSFCEGLISKLHLSTLENLLNSWSVSGGDLIQFKRDFTRSEFFNDICQHIVKLLVYRNENKLPMLEHLWNILLCDVEEVTRFKEDFTTNEFFFNSCGYLFMNEDLSTLEQLLNLCLPDDGRFEKDLLDDYDFITYFKRRIKHNDLDTLERFMKICFADIGALSRFDGGFVGKEFFKKCCEELVEDNKVVVLERVFNLCLSNTEESVLFKRDLIKMKYSYYHDIDWNTSRVNKLLNLCLSNSPESVAFMRDLVNNSNEIEYECLHYYARKDLKSLNELLNVLFLSRMDLVAEYKRKLLMLPDGIEDCVDKFFEKFVDLSEIISDAFPGVDSANEYKRMVVFSPLFIRRLRDVIIEGEGLNKVRKRIDNFLTSNEDKSVLKKQLIDHLEPDIINVYYKYVDSDWQSLMQWCYEDDEAVQKLKDKLPIDEIFETRLKECIFQTYDQHHRVSRCFLHKKLNFTSLDEFLSWYFVSPNAIKEYKLQRIESYEDVKPISTLLKKNCHSAYVRKLLEWFFQNDNVEIAKFKKKHKGEKIVNMVRIVRESYFKQRHSF